MRVLVIAPPAAVVSLEEAKEHLKVLHDDEDGMIEAMVAAVTETLDGWSGWLGRAIGQQTLELRREQFGLDPILLPCPPIVSVSSVKYLDNDGVEQTLAADRYEVRDCQIVPAFGTSWPTTRFDDEAVRIRYEAGYSTLPSAIRAAILLGVGDLYAFRETVVTGTIAVSVPMSTTVTNLLSKYRVYA